MLKNPRVELLWPSLLGWRCKKGFLSIVCHGPVWHTRITPFTSAE